MSMMKFDDSKIKEIRKRKEQGLPPPPTSGDVVEQSKNAILSDHSFKGS